MSEWLKKLFSKNVPERQNLSTDDWFDALFEDALKTVGVDVAQLSDEQRAELEAAHESATFDAIELIAQKLVGGWKSQSRRELRREAKERVRFEARVHRLWGQAIERLEMFRSICLMIGSEFNHTYRGEATNTQDYRFDALNRLHAHTCLVAGEMIVLLKHGYAHGAYSRWRTLHELVVTAYFINQYGSDIAERFLLHDQIESYRAAKEYEEKYAQFREFFEAGGHEPIEQELIAELEIQYDQLCARFGSDYSKQYGWAATALQDRSPSFKKIEAAVGLSNMRPFYRLASHHVHPESKTLLRTMGQPPHDRERSLFERTMMAGPSIYGLADAGQGATITLLQMTICFLSRHPTIGQTAYMLALETLSQEVVDTFIQVNDRLEGFSTEESNLKI